MNYWNETYLSNDLLSDLDEDDEWIFKLKKIDIVDWIENWFSKELI